MTTRGCRDGICILFCTSMLGACAETPPPPNAITVERLEEIHEAQKIASTSSVKTTVKLHDRGDTMSPPAVTQKPGHTASLELVREFIYPTDFKLSQMPPLKTAKLTDGVPPVTPTTPTKFEKKSMGVQMTLTPRFEGGLVVLTGEVVISEHAGTTHAAGEVAGRPIIASKDNPILITPNKVDLPMFREARTPVFVTALPGRTYTMEVMGLKGPMRVDFTCEVVPEKKG